MEAEAILELWLLVPWVLVALAAVVFSVVVLRVSTEDAAVVVLEEDSAAVEEDSEAATEEAIEEVIEAAMAHLVMPRPALDSTAETAAAMVTGTVATEGVVTEAPVGMILVAAVAHLTTDTAAADTAENARTDAQAATWNPSEVDEKVGIANNGTETTTDPVMMMVAESVAMTAAMRILESFVVINGVILHDLVWWVADLLSVINSDHFSTKGRVSTPLSPNLGS